jgi:hypothetical protein
MDACGVMVLRILLLLGMLRALVRRRSDLVLENLALRQQVAAFAARNQRPRITVVPTVTFRQVYGWFAIDHARRRILHCDATDAPTAAWVVQHLRETFVLDVMPRHLIFDRDSIFSAQVVSTVKSCGIKPTRTVYRSPWQNGVAERWFGSVRSPRNTFALRAAVDA